MRQQLIRASVVLMGAFPPLVERPVASSVEELLTAATDRQPLVSGDSKTGARLERVVIGGEPHVVKHLHVDDDWLMRSTGDLRCRPLLVWRSGLLDLLPACIDHAVVGAASGEGRNGWGAALLMRDVTPFLVPEGDQRVSMDQHHRFLTDMAALHAAFWDWTDNVGLLPVSNRYLAFGPESVAVEGRRGWPDAVPRLIVDGWGRFAALADPVAGPVISLARDPSALVDALAGEPATLLHGDWKLGNLGSLPDGRTVLLDWALPGRGSPTGELAHYLALNTARLPETKESAIGWYRDSLEASGISTGGWWERDLALGLLAGVVWFGWEKALGGPGPELSWWLERAADGLRFL
jgi:hypothetical protein